MGCRGKCFGSCLLCLVGPGALSLALSSAPRFGPALSEAPFSARFQAGASALLSMGARIVTSFLFLSFEDILSVVQRLGGISLGKKLSTKVKWAVVNSS